MTNKKVRWLILAAITVILYSCETQPDVPLVVATVVPTTTTTVRAPVMIISQAPPATTTTTTVAPAPKPALPSISEPEYRNLFATVNTTFKDILFYDIDALLPEAFAAADAKFQGARANYETQIWRWPYDGEASYPFAGDLRNSGTSLTAVLEKGFPLRSDAEKAKAGYLADMLRPADLPDSVAQRLAEAKAEYASGNDAHAKVQYRDSIASFMRAILVYRSADARAKAEELQAKAMASGYGRYSPYHLDEAERYLIEDASLYALSENSGIERGIGLLEKASRYYANILSWGAEREAGEARDKALLARLSADWLNAELNAAEEYSGAAKNLAEAESRQEAQHFTEASALYDEAARGFEIARLSASSLECSAATSLQKAAQAAFIQKERLREQGFEADSDFLEAEEFIASADNKLSLAMYADSRQDSLDALARISSSEERLHSLLRDREAEREASRLQEEADSLAMEEAAAAQAAAEAEARATAQATVQAAAEAVELSLKSAELEALRAALAIKDAEAREAQARELKASQALAELQARADAQAAAEHASADAAAAQEAAANAAQAEAAIKAAQDEQDARDLQAAQAAAAAQTAAAQTAALRAEAIAAIEEARQRYDWAVSKNAKNNYPEALSAGGQTLDNANSAFDSGNIEEALALARSALATLSSVKEYAELPAAYIIDLLPERKNIDSFTSIARAEYGYNDAKKWPILYEANRSILKDPSNPNLLLSGQTVVIPSIRGELRSGTWDPKKTYPIFERGPGSDTEVIDAIDQARKSYDRALARNARNNYPALLAEGSRDLEAARKAYDTGDVATASAKATKARAILESIGEFAPLPASYKIGLVPELRNTDSLWTIAASAFVYNDPYKWPVLYKANKASLPDPANPNLLKSGQIIVIPSIGGERRDGLWDPKKTYPVYK